MYYNRKSKETYTRSLRDFHNRYVKHNELYQCQIEVILIDMSVGKGVIYKMDRCKIIICIWN